MDKTLILTEDGSHTLFHPELNEHYHSTHGAIQESTHIFIEQGFNTHDHVGNTVNVLEVGFGTGLNTLLTVIEARERKLKVNYVSLEPFPLTDDELKGLNYPGLVGSCNERVLFWELHHTPWGQPYYLNDDFILLRIQAKLQDVSLQAARFDVVYFDAFSPEVQPELWTADIFSQVFAAMAPGGLLTTYSAKGEVKRNLAAAGFEVEGIPGPPGKREITRARKPW
jgi:tRNA U34 5-methylaminomethyl-2-thiouridine-forming methyltransferase MnmC